MGELFVLIFFGWVAVCGVVFVQTGAWPAAGLLLGWQIGLLSAALISVNNLRDRAEDSTTGKRTIAVRLGHKSGIALIAVEIALALAAGIFWPVLGLPSFAWASLAVLPLAAVILAGVLRHPPGPAYNRFLALAGVQLLGFAACFHVLAARGG